MDLQHCVFHARTSSNAAADELVPVSALRHTDPEAFFSAIAKYDDSPERQRLRDTWIPTLEARWTDVVFLSPIHPHAIWRAWRDVAGIDLPSQEFWAIPVEDVGRAVIFDRHLSSSGDPIDPREIAELDPGDYRAAQETTPKSIEWIKHLAGENKRGAWFHGTPHILTRGPVSLESAAVIDWQQPTAEAG